MIASRTIYNGLKGARTKLNITSRLLIRNSSNQPQIQHEPVETVIPVPWGQISGVHWGPKDRQPILALHGWQDNAGTWKQLIPHLDQNLGILAVDLPGHGKSSWYPPGVMYNYNDNVLIMRRIVQHFGWKSVSFLGHSMGAILSFVYGSLYPNEVKFMVLLDNLKPITKRRKDHIGHTGRAIDKLLAIDRRNIEGGEPPSYTYDELIERLHIGQHKSVDKDKCHVLLDRSIAKSSKNPEKYYFTRDSKLKHFHSIGTDPNDVRAMTERMTMPILNLKFERAPYFEPVEHFQETFDALKANNKDFEGYRVPGTHHAHINNPEDLAPYINDFIKKHDR